MINALGRFQAAELDRTYKYMLAAAYIKGQAVDTFSVRDKEAILSKVTWQSENSPDISFFLFWYIGSPFRGGEFT